MIAAAPFMWRRAAVAWALLMLASLATWTPAPWWLIDACGVVVFVCWRQWQSRLIAVAFAVMLWADLFHTGAYPISEALGWLQLLCLFQWASTGLQQNPLRGVPT